MEEGATPDTANNNYYGDHDVVAIVVHNAAEVQVPLPPLCLLVGMLFVGVPPSTRS